jgi:hypothetical protein
MEGENKNMKMKKLTALALAGALCLGMSTVALAAPSVGPEDAYSATSKDGQNVDLDVTNVPEWANGTLRGTQYDGWDSADAEDASDAVKDTLKRSSEHYGTRLEYLKQLGDPDRAGEIAELEKQRAAVDELANSDVLIEIADLVELNIKNPSNANPVDPRHPLTVKFVLNKRLENLAVGQQIRIMHKVDGLWQVYEGEVKWDAASSEFYVEHSFTELSPVAILRVNSDGSAQVTPPAQQPGDTNQPTVTPDGNGQITADQLAELLVKKLQANGAVKFDRTATSGKASPKTGE